MVIKKIETVTIQFLPDQRKFLILYLQEQLETIEKEIKDDDDSENCTRSYRFLLNMNKREMFNIIETLQTPIELKTVGKITLPIHKDKEIKKGNDCIVKDGKLLKPGEVEDTIAYETALKRFETYITNKRKTKYSMPIYTRVRKSKTPFTIHECIEGIQALTPKITNASAPSLMTSLNDLLKGFCENGYLTRERKGKGFEYRLKVA